MSVKGGDSNQGGGSGGTGLSAIQGTTGGRGFSLRQSFPVPGRITITIETETNVRTVYVSHNIRDISQYIKDVGLFCTYCIKNVKVVFNLDYVSFNNAFSGNYTPGTCAFCWVPWTQEFSVSSQQNQTTFAFALPGKKYAYFVPYQEGRPEILGPQNLTRMQEITYQPKYIQRDLTRDFTGQRNGVNFSDAPIMLWSDRGYDNTDWFGFTATLQVQNEPPSGGSNLIITIPVITEFDVEFSGIRWLGLSPVSYSGYPGEEQDDKVLGNDNLGKSDKPRGRYLPLRNWGDCLPKSSGKCSPQVPPKLRRSQALVDCSSHCQKAVILSPRITKFNMAAPTGDKGPIKIPSIWQ